MCFTLGASIAEIVSAYPTCGGLYVTLLSSIHTIDTHRTTFQVHRLGSARSQEVQCQGMSEQHNGGQ